MLSTIVYGRNDGYSYELNRRTALGLNQLARQLAPGQDEIVFVDYNTDDDLPTHAEAIADTLTPRAVQLIRVIRVRPGFHADQPAAGPPVREAISRNIALRRLSPGAEWVLSTNPDCLLITAEGPSLSARVAKLPDGYFGLPRFELPRFIWESLPRAEPKMAAETARVAAKALGLEEEVRHYLPAIGYDAPGDLQLVRAAELTAICGFDEAMTQGWHIDSNLNARLALRHGALTDLNAASGGTLLLFHTEHARRFSAKHASGRAEDPFEAFVTGVSDPVPEAQKDSWGAPEEIFEEFPLADPPARRLIHQIVAGTKSLSASYVYGPESFDCIPREDAFDAHLFGFVFDHLAYLAPGVTIGWFGDDDGRAGRFAAAAQAAGLANPIEIAAEAAEITPVLGNAEILILDAGAGEVAEAALIAIIQAERASANHPRRVIGLNVPHGAFEAPFLTHIPSVMAPVATRIRFGEVAPSEVRIDLSGGFTPGEAGEWVEGRIQAVAGREGYVALTRRPILPGRWRLDYTVALDSLWGGRAVIDVALQAEEAAHEIIAIGARGLLEGSLEFNSDRRGLFGGGFECRLWADGAVKIAMVGARLTPLDG